MDMKHCFFLEMLFLTSLCSHQVSVQSNGDSLLIKPKQPIPSRDPTGSLEIYLNGTWGTFCSNQFDSTTANVACRQLGYLEGVIPSNASGNLDFQVPLATISTPIHVGSTLCCEPKDDSVNIMHILRCNVDLTGTPSTCTHDNDIILECSLFPVYIMDGYDTQLYLNAKALNSHLFLVWCPQDL